MSVGIIKSEESKPAVSGKRVYRFDVLYFQGDLNSLKFYHEVIVNGIPNLTELTYPSQIDFIETGSTITSTTFASIVDLSASLDNYRVVENIVRGVDVFIKNGGPDYLTEGNVILRRETNLTQEIDFQGTKFPAKVVEGALDKVTFLIQELEQRFANFESANGMTDDERSKLAGIEEGADVTDEENVKTALENMSLVEYPTAFLENIDHVIIRDRSNNDSLRTTEISSLVLSQADNIKLAYESRVDTNAFTDSYKNKLDGIEANATADQTKADIDALNIDSATVNGLTVETAVPAGAVFTDTTYSIQDGELSQNNFTNADHDKLDGIEANATADQNADEVPYDNTISGLTATNVKDAIDELEASGGSGTVTNATNISGFGSNTVGLFSSLNGSTLEFKSILNEPSATGLRVDLDNTDPSEVALTLDYRGLGQVPYSLATGADLISFHDVSLPVTAQAQVRSTPITEFAKTLTDEMIINNTGSGEDIYGGTASGEINVKSLVAGTNISLSSNANEITINSTASGSGAVDSVNTQTGVVVLDADDIDDTATTHKFVTSADLTKLSNTSGTNTGDQDLSDFETTTQLNTRDTNNRNRTNHTGTQLASTISNFAATVRDTVLTGLTTVSSAAIAATDSVIEALQKIQAQINLKADASNVIERDNTDVFTPSLDYHPATKKYVDDNAGGGGGSFSQLMNNQLQTFKHNTFYNGIQAGIGDAGTLEFPSQMFLRDFENSSFLIPKGTIPKKIVFNYPRGVNESIETIRYVVALFDKSTFEGSFTQNIIAEPEFKWLGSSLALPTPEPSNFISFNHEIDLTTENGEVEVLSEFAHLTILKVGNSAAFSTTAYTNQRYSALLLG